MLSPVEASDVPHRTKKAYRRALAWMVLYALASISTAAMLLIPSWGIDCIRSHPSWCVTRCADGVVWIRWWPGREKQGIQKDGWDIGVPYVFELSDAGSFDNYTGLISLHGDQVSLVVYLWWPAVLAWSLLMRAAIRYSTLRKRLHLFLCWNCGYDLRGSVGERCSECGSHFVRGPQ